MSNMPWTSPLEFVALPMPRLFSPLDSLESRVYAGYLDCQEETRAIAKSAAVEQDSNPCDEDVGHHESKSLLASLRLLVAQRGSFLTLGPHC